MNKKITSIISIAMVFTAMINLTAQEDKYVKLANKVSISADSDAWLKVSVPFNLISHPRLEDTRNSRPSTLEEAFNPEYLEGLKVKLYLCFNNEFKKKVLRSSKLIDSQFYQYYGAEVEFKTIKIERTTKYANFVFPAAIAEKDGFGGSYINPVGYAVEIFVEGVPAEISNDIFFDKYRDEPTLMKFKQQAQEKSSQNEGVLLPAHHVFSNYFQKGAYLVPKE